MEGHGVAGLEGMKRNAGAKTSSSDFGTDSWRNQFHTWGRISSTWNPSTLMLDQDKGARIITKAMIRATLQVLGIPLKGIRWKRSTNGGKHWFVDLAEPVKDPVLACAIQACMGSDLKRETLNLARARRYRDADSIPAEFNLFYDRKVKVVHGKTQKSDRRN